LEATQNSNNEKDQMIEERNREILGLVKKYVKRQSRQVYPKTNVIYIITTKSMREQRSYKIGKTKDLMARLSTYNSLGECIVEFYKECMSEEIMDLAEKVIFLKMKEYRPAANREKFVLPDGKDIDLFIEIVKTQIEHLE
jgi:hypothetical protein